MLITRNAKTKVYLNLILRIFSRCSIRLLYPQIGIGLGSSLRGIFKKLASFIAYYISIKVKVFALELAKAEVKT